MEEAETVEVTELYLFFRGYRFKPVKPTVIELWMIALKKFVRELNDVVVSINIIQGIYSTQNLGVDECNI